MGKVVLRLALGLAACGAVLLGLRTVARRRDRPWGQAATRLLARRRSASTAEPSLQAAVGRELTRTARTPTAIQVSIEHGCVELRGPVDTRERGRIVAAVAAVAGVDSVIDLMTEPAPDERHAVF